MGAPVLSKRLLAVGQSQQVMPPATTAFLEPQQQYVAVPVPVQPVLAAATGFPGTIVTSLPPPSDVCHTFLCQQCMVLRCNTLKLIWKFFKLHLPWFLCLACAYLFLCCIVYIYFYLIIITIKNHWDLCWSWSSYDKAITKFLCHLINTFL
jgi:hypothetical protein